MEFMGEILGKSGSPGIDRRHRIGLIREHPDLAPPRPREGINPFTKGPITFQPRPNVAQVIVGGEEAGTMSWAEDDSGLINASGGEAAVPVAEDVAELLGGRFQPAAH